MELSLEKYICIPKHALFQGDDQELALWEVLLYHLPNVLGVLQVKRGINFIKNVKRGRLVLEKGQYK